MSDHPFGLTRDPFSRGATLSADETRQLIQQRVSACGGDGESLFTPEACAEIHRHADGDLEAINALAREALRRAAEGGAASVLPVHVEAVARDLASEGEADETSAASVFQLPHEPSNELDPKAKAWVASFLAPKRPARVWAPARFTPSEEPSEVLPESATEPRDAAPRGESPSPPGDAEPRAESATAPAPEPPAEPTAADSTPPAPGAESAAAAPTPPAPRAEPDAEAGQSRKSRRRARAEARAAAQAGARAAAQARTRVAAQAESRVAALADAGDVKTAAARLGRPDPVDQVWAPVPASAVSHRRRQGGVNIAGWTAVAALILIVIMVVIQLRPRGRRAEPQATKTSGAVVSGSISPLRASDPDSVVGQDPVVPPPASRATRKASPARNRATPTRDPGPAPEASPSPPAAEARFGLEVGSFIIPFRAKEELERLVSAGHPVRMITDWDDGAEVYRVVLGSFPSREAAERAADRLLTSGTVVQARVITLGSRRGGSR
jgi:hypothetical protein